jgi:phosphoglycolate phosphatase-like HAD superfamily hydrolase
VVPLESFTTVVCCGGDPQFEMIPGSRQKKTAAYTAACQSMGVPPELVVCCEDSVDGLEAARAASLVRLGLQRPGNPQHLAPHADLVLSDFAPLADPEVTELLISTPVEEVLTRLRCVMCELVVD